MNPKYLLSGLLGAVVGAVGMYFVLDRIHEKELMDVYSELGDVQEGLEEATRDLDAIVDAEDTDLLIRAGAVLVIDEEDEDLPTADDFDDDDRKANLKLLEEYVGEEDEDEDPDDEPVVDTLAGIYIINPEDVTDRQVVCTYNHDDGSAEVAKMLSVESESFDDIIENDILYTLLADEAYDIIMNSDPLPEGADKRLICVRNTIINLDFVISY